MRHDKHGKDDKKTPIKPPVKPSQWKGEAVAPAPTGQAERAAARAEGRVAPERGGAAGRPDAPVEEESLAQQPLDPRRRAPSGEDPADKIAEAAEAHQERATSDDRPARGKL
jgi:hypothetical protein